MLCLKFQIIPYVINIPLYTSLIHIVIKCFFSLIYNVSIQELRV